jgi:hypothetical protein
LSGDPVAVTVAVAVAVPVAVTVPAPVPVPAPAPVGVDDDAGGAELAVRYAKNSAIAAIPARARCERRIKAS